MNRKNPETQRWQFYHPHFQRDYPQLRKNIKRKSARSMNTAPATSRVVFEHGKGYFLQRNDRSRSNSGESSQSQALVHAHHQSRGPTQPTSSPSHQSQMGPVSPQLQRQSPTGGAHGSEQRDRDHRPQFSYPYSQSDASRSGSHQRQQTYPNGHSADHPYDNNASEPSHDGSFARPLPPSSPYIGRVHASGNGHFQNMSGADHRKSSMQSMASDQSSPLVRHQDPSLPHPQQRPHGSIGDGSVASQSPRGEPLDKDGRGAAGHPGSAHTFGSPHPSHHDPQRTDRPHSMGGGPGPKDFSQPNPSLPSGNKFNAPPASQALPSPAIPSPSSASPFPSAGHHQQPLSQPPPPTSPQHTDRFSPATAKELENRLHYMEDAYTALRQYAQRLEQAQAVQDRTIQWMRERIDQMTDATHGHRDSIASPLTPQSGVISTTKRKADPLPDDPRSRSRFETGTSRYDSEAPPLEHREHYPYGHHMRSGPGSGYEVSSNGGYHHHHHHSASLSSEHPPQQHYHDGPAHMQQQNPHQAHHSHQQQQQHSQGMQSHQYRSSTAQGKVF
ncbi:MAG: hypothetical protein J3Q66DRAFT_323620 [Benniella sp.]|nr:MAG: hypothetical protein J3Q66DRAFT_323620 [Benniella sp.]